MNVLGSFRFQIQINNIKQLVLYISSFEDFCLARIFYGNNISIKVDNKIQSDKKKIQTKFCTTFCRKIAEMEESITCESPYRNIMLKQQIESVYLKTWLKISIKIESPAMNERKKKSIVLLKTQGQGSFFLNEKKNLNKSNRFIWLIPAFLTSLINAQTLLVARGSISGSSALLW